MANELTDTGESLALDFLNGRTASVTGPMKLALLTAQGSDSASGIEVSGAGYARQEITFGAASGGSTSNTNLVSYTDMPACVVVGFAIYDSSGTAKRLWEIPRTGGPATVNAGDTFQVPIGGVTLGMD